MDRHAHVLFKDMGNVVFAHIEFAGKGIEAQILIQMRVDIFAKSGKKAALFALGSRWAFAHIDNAVDAEQQGCNVAGDHGIMKRNVALTFFDDVDQFVKEDLGIGKVTGKMMAGDLVSIIETIGDIRVQCL